MRRALGGVVLALAMVAGMGGAHAIDVRNEDQRSYSIQITSSTMTRDIELRAQSLSLVVCVGTCEFFVPGVGRTKAKGNDIVSIKNGRIATEKDTRSASAK